MEASKEAEAKKDVRDVREARKLLKAGKLKLHCEKELKSALSRG